MVIIIISLVAYLKVMSVPGKKEVERDKEGWDVGGRMLGRCHINLVDRQGLLEELAKT